MDQGALVQTCCVSVFSQGLIFGSANVSVVDSSLEGVMLHKY